MNKNIRDSGRKKEILTIDRIDSLSLLLWAFATLGLLLFIGFKFVGLIKPEDNEYNWFFYLDAFILAVVIMLQLLKLLSFMVCKEK